MNPNRRKGGRQNDFNEEAEEDNFVISEDDQIAASEEDGEDLMDNLDKDYEFVEKLDEYDYDDLDERSYSNMSIDAKRRAEEALDRRDRAMRQKAANS